MRIPPRRIPRPSGGSGIILVLGLAFAISRLATLDLGSAEAPTPPDTGALAADALESCIAPLSDKDECGQDETRGAVLDAKRVDTGGAP